MEAGTLRNRGLIVDAETGEIFDDAQGYDTSPHRRHMLHMGTKLVIKAKTKRRKKKRDLGNRKWMREHPDFVGLMDQTSFEIWKGSWRPDTRFDAKLVGEMFKTNGYETDFTAGQLIRVWEKTNR